MVGERQPTDGGGDGGEVSGMAGGRRCVLGGDGGGQCKMKDCHFTGATHRYFYVSKVYMFSWSLPIIVYIFIYSVMISILFTFLAKYPIY
jgi:hypothetical protein